MLMGGEGSGRKPVWKEILDISCKAGRIFWLIVLILVLAGAIGWIL
jgi:hypothetical protein